MQEAHSIFEQDDVKGALEPTEKELDELRITQDEAILFFDDIDKIDDNPIIEKFVLLLSPCWRGRQACNQCCILLQL